jgi:hypothetical protein
LSGNSFDSNSRTKLFVAQRLSVFRQPGVQLLALWAINAGESVDGDKVMTI